MIDFNKTIHALPPEFQENLRISNRNIFLSSGISIIVLDDDPTGTQTMFDVPVLTSWGEPEIRNELENKTALFFILTNSRSLMAERANHLAKEIGQNIKIASVKTGRKTLVISRSDSTLRGHFPNEVDALAAALGCEHAPQIIIPAFFQGGRFTINDIHYVRNGNELVPAAETPFAKDATFGYRSSDLKEYIQEKSSGRIKADEVVSVSIEDIRIGGPKRIYSILNSLGKKQICIVNAVSQSDLDVFVAGFYRWQIDTSSVIFRTAASIIPSLAGVKVKTPLQPKDLSTNGKGGVIAVGSYVPKTTEQLAFLKKNFNVEYVEMDAQLLAHSTDFQIEVERVGQIINLNLKNNRVVVVYTSREIIKGNNPEESLMIVNRISRGMVEAIKNISTRPGFFIAKGGITSSDIVTKAFQVKRVQVLGQIIPGVSVWTLDDCRQFPGLLFMPFPGNVGGEDALFQAVKKLI